MARTLAPATKKRGGGRGGEGRKSLTNSRSAESFVSLVLQLMVHISKPITEFLFIFGEKNP